MHGSRNIITKANRHFPLLNAIIVKLCTLSAFTVLGCLKMKKNRFSLLDDIELSLIFGNFSDISRQTVRPISPIGRLLDLLYMVLWYDPLAGQTFYVTSDLGSRENAICLSPLIQKSCGSRSRLVIQERRSGGLADRLYMTRKDDEGGGA